MYREVTIGVINVLMGLDVFQLLPKLYTGEEKFGRAILTTSSALLVAGVLFAQKKHRANILIIWLFSSLVYIGTYIYGIDKWFYKSCVILYIYGILLVCMEAVIYKAYLKELEQSIPKDPNVCESKSVVEKPPMPTAPMESNPPSYEAMAPQIHVY
ncbi:uncharacterized protein LOC110184092 [Drosophila serrata]|uniref:uncharacterized protein LOC110184092 n=1 Tax=Drosophila serrata TaxID=7274 RepID=UPI000A1D0A32|nr:uncharacterized protein LOC110184092 [Drosophila serrata]